MELLALACASFVLRGEARLCLDSRKRLLELEHTSAHACWWTNVWTNGVLSK